MKRERKRGKQRQRERERKGKMYKDDADGKKRRKCDSLRLDTGKDESPGDGEKGKNFQIEIVSARLPENQNLKIFKQQTKGWKIYF